MSGIARTEEATVEFPASARSVPRLGNAITRYWGEAIVVALALLLWLPRLSGPIDLRWDGGVYYLLGTSLATGHGYRILSEPGAPEAIQYPPLLAAVVALHERVLGTTDPSVVAPWLRRSYAAMFILFGVSLLAFAKRVLSKGFAVIAVALCLCQVMTVFMSDLLFTELPFALLSVLFVLVATRDGPRSDPWLRESLMFFLAAAGFLLRTAGLALLGAWVIDAFIHRHWRLALIRLALALIPIVAWQSYIGNVRGSREYTHPAYEYQRAPYQYSNVSYAENASLVDPFRPELGRLDASALATRLTSNVPSMLLALGQAVSVREGEWDRLLAKIQHKLLGRSIAPRKIASIAIFPLAAIVVLGLLVFLRRGAWIIVLIGTCFAGAYLDDTVARSIQPISDAAGPISCDLSGSSLVRN